MGVASVEPWILGLELLRVINIYIYVYTYICIYIYIYIYIYILYIYIYIYIYDIYNTIEILAQYI